MTHQVLRASRGKLIGVTIGSLLFVAYGFYTGIEKPSSYPGAIFFGLCFLIGFVQLLPQAAYLEITDDGFTFCNLFRKKTVPWEEIQEFSHLRVGLNQMTAWNFVQGAYPESKLRSVSKSISGYDATFPDTYGMKAEALAEFMNAYLARSRARAASADKR